MSRARIHTRSSGRTLAYVYVCVYARVRAYIYARGNYTTFAQRAAETASARCTHDVHAARCRNCKRALRARRINLKTMPARILKMARAGIWNSFDTIARKEARYCRDIIRTNDAAKIRHELHSWRKQYRIDVYDWHHRHGWCHRHHPRGCPLEVTPREVYRRDGIHHPIQTLPVVLEVPQGCPPVVPEVPQVSCWGSSFEVSQGFKKEYI